MTSTRGDSIAKGSVPRVTGQDILAGLRDVGLGAGDVVMVHSSLSGLGYVAGGAGTVIDALLEAVGAQGTVVVPTFTWERYHQRHGFTFDVAGASVVDEVGLIPETFRQRPAAVRSRHVCHSVAAIGPDARLVMGAGVRSFGPGSSFDALYQLDAWVLLLGVGFTACTALHMVEEYRQVPYRSYRDFGDCQILLPDGTTEPSRAVEYLKHEGYQNDFGKMDAVLARAGVLRTGRIGAAEVTGVRIRDLFDVTMTLLRDDVGFLLTRESQALLREDLARGLAVAEPLELPRRPGSAPCLAADPSSPRLA